MEEGPSAPRTHGERRHRAHRKSSSRHNYYDMSRAVRLMPVSSAERSLSANALAISGMNEAPRASTSKEGTAEPRFSVNTNRTAYHNTPSPTQRPELWRHEIATPPPQTNNDVGVFGGTASALAKLQTFLPTGTWLTYTALETWAFSLRPGDPPISALSNCNAHQRSALLIVLVLCAVISFFSSFIKRFIYDTENTHVVFPPPDYYTVPEIITEPVTGVQFPCRTRQLRYCWPLVNTAGEFVYDELGVRLRVAVFRADVPVLPGRRSIWNLRAWFGPDLGDPVPAAPQLHPTPMPTPHPTPAVLSALSIDAVVRAPPELKPRWTHTLLGTQGGTAYADLRPRVWGHAFVSLTAFLALALCSAQVSGCLYPEVPDFLPPPLQTGILAVLAIAAAVAVRDRAVGFGQSAMRLHPQRKEDTEVPEHLRSVVETVVWVGRQDLGVKEKS